MVNLPSLRDSKNSSTDGGPLQSFYVQIAEIPDGLLKPTVGLSVSLGTSTLNIETIDVAAAMKNPGVLFKLVKFFENQGVVSCHLNHWLIVNVQLLVNLNH